VTGFLAVRPRGLPGRRPVHACHDREGTEEIVMSGTLIVGWSLAGLSTARSLRQKGYAGTIDVLAQEVAEPYDRPPLSKKFLSGEIDHERLLLLAADRMEALDVNLHLGHSAVALDLEGRAVVDDRDVRHEYENLVMATGMRPRELPDFPRDVAHYVRTTADIDRLRGEIHAGTRMLVVGGGFLGLELAATASQLCASVVVVELDPTPLQARLGPAAAEAVLALHEEHGVQVFAGTSVTEVARNDDVTAISLSDGTQIEVDVIVVAIGSVANIEWLEGSGLDLTDGVGCESTLQAAEHVWAVGDIARWYHQGYGRSMRLEHRQNAVAQAGHVAKSIIGEPSPFIDLPYFWTDQFAARVQSAGLTGRGLEPGEVVRSARGFIQTFSLDGHVVGVVGFGAPKEFLAERMKLSAEGAPV